MSLRNDPNYFPQPDVPTNGNYGSNFGKEQMYYGYSPSSAAIDAANAAAGEKTYSSGKYVYNSATGQYTWVPAGAATPTPTTPTTPVTTLEPPGGAENGQSPGPGGGYGIPGATMVDGISGPTTGLASLANSAAARLGNMSTQNTGIYGGVLRGISDALARNVDPNFSHEGRVGRGASDSGTDPNTGNTGTSTNTGDTGMNTGTSGGSPEQAGDIGGGGSYGGYDGGDPGGGGARANGGVVGRFAHGGLGSLGGYSDGGRLLRGPGDGVSDSIPATIGRAKRPARLADGEFVVPARIVSELGNGSTEAGARKLYAMLARIQAGRKKSVGRGKVAVNSRMDKHLPA
jgi:hypothetical protein